MSTAIGVQLERNHALADAKKTIDMYGSEIAVFNESEATLERDKYNSIKKTTLTKAKRYVMKAYPVTFQPSRKKLDELGMKDQVQAVIYTAMKDWNNYNVRFEDIDMIRGRVMIDGEKYMIREKMMDADFADTHLYVVLGLGKI